MMFVLPMALGLLGCSNGDAAEITATLGTGRGADFVAYEDGGDATLMWGTQGGVMITPTVRLEAAGGSVPKEQVELLFRHGPAAEHEDAFMVGSEFAEYRVSAPADPLAPVLGEFQDQLGWDDTIHDTWMRLEVEVRGAGFTATHALTLHLVDPDIGSFCREITESNGGCRYLVVPGKATIARVNDTMVEYTFAADDPAAEECETQPLGFLRPEPGNECYENAMITQGAEIDVIEWRSLAGCPPRTAVAACE